ncbi:hypothetical protein ACQ4PT_016816 [Festuca glaucescens]
MASPPHPVLSTLLLFLLLLLLRNAAGAAAASSAVNPFTAKAAFIRYWNRKVPNNRPHPAFFVSKLSPLSAADAASFPSSFADIRARLPTLCSKASLLCPSSDANGNVVTANFTSYAGGATGGSGSFTAYATETNAPDSKFTNYDAGANGRARGFTTYSQDANTGTNNFAGYGKSGNRLRETFTSYGNGTNVLSSGFANYGKSANGATDTFTGFTSYAKGANGGAAEFRSYGGSGNQGSVAFKGYGEGTNPNHHIGFKAYAGDNTTFKGYAKTGVDFKEYHNTSGGAATAMLAETATSGHQHMKWDKMPPRAFLPRDIAMRIPFQPNAVSEVFMVPLDTAMGKAVASTVSECERPPSQGETKRCATSAEDIVDFAVEMLGNDIVVHSTASTAGSGGDIRLGNVTGVDGGKVTRSVSCHQSLFPYLVYYCHSVPKARVYQADIMAADSDQKINHGVAICHVDTSDWSRTHGAFIALGGKPGETEVCHWIFEGDMTWTVAD